MPVDVLMPKLSDTMEEGKILKWFKQPGERVAIGDILAEVETDKANMELEAFDEGVLAEVRTAEGESAPVGAVIATLAAAGEAKPAAASNPAAAPAAKPAPAAAKPAATAVAKPGPAAAAKLPAATTSSAAAKAAPAASRAAAAETDGEADAETGRESDDTKTAAVSTRARAAAAPARGAERPPAAASSEQESRVKASPLARRLAEEHGVSLEGLTGTGPGGRIVERDVMAARDKAGGAAAKPSEQGSAPPAAERRPPAAGAQGSAPSRRVELSKMRRTTARRMAEAKRDVPHFYASADIAMDEAVRLKEGLVGLGAEYEGLTFTHMVVKAVGLALRRVPEMNASLDGDDVQLHEAVNVGVATAVDDGLIVPVVRGADAAPLATLVGQMRGLVERARRGRFGADDLSGGTFTVSNLGMYPVSHFAAVVNPPQAAILAVGTVRHVAVVRDGLVVPGDEMTVTLSCDHRVVDGVLAGRFLRELKRLLENPLALVS